LEIFNFLSRLTESEKTPLEPEGPKGVFDDQTTRLGFPKHKTKLVAY
jgi:hypothetical protein